MIRIGVIVGFGWAVRRVANKTAVGWIDGGRPSAVGGLFVAGLVSYSSDRTLSVDSIGIPNTWHPVLNERKRPSAVYTTADRGRRTAVMIPPSSSSGSQKDGSSLYSVGGS